MRNNPLIKFWDYVESCMSQPEREKWADEKMRRSLDRDTTDPDPKRADEKVLEETKVVDGGERVLQERHEIMRAAYRSIPEGGKFQFLRVVSCGADGREEESEGRNVSEGTSEREQGKVEIDWATKVWIDSSPEPEQEEAKGQCS